MAEKLEVFVLEPYEVDWFAFSLWLEGCSEEVATEKRREREERELENFRDFPDYDVLLRSETKHDYRVFRALEVHLHNPPSLFAQVKQDCKRHMAVATCTVAAAGDAVGGWLVEGGAGAMLFCFECKAIALTVCTPPPPHTHSAT